MKKENYASNTKLTDTKEKSEALKTIARLDKKMQNKTFQNVKKHDELIVHIRENMYANRKVVQAQFKTLGCRLKKSGSCWNCNYGVSDECLITPKQYIRAFENGILNISGNVLVLEALGSITDPKEFDPNVFKSIMEIAIENDNFNTILIETHINQIPEELVEYISNVNNGKKHIGFEVGIEDMDQDNRMLINKLGVQNSKLNEVYNTLQKYGMSLGINLIYGFPFMNEQERIQAVVNSVKSISQNLPEAEIILFLMSIKENTIMEYMQRLGIYKPANPWGLVETTRQILSDDSIQNLVTFSWFGEKEDPYIHEQTCYTCPDCKKMIVDCFRNINGTFDSKERKEILDDLIKQAQEAKCGCYNEFKEQLKQSDGKSPSIRYEEFIEKVRKIMDKTTKIMERAKDENVK